MSQETARRYLEKQVPVLSRLKKGNYTHSRYQSEIQKILQKNKTKPNKQKKTDKADCSFSDISKIMDVANKQNQAITKMKN